MFPVCLIIVHGHPRIFPLANSVKSVSTPSTTSTRPRGYGDNTNCLITAQFKNLKVACPCNLNFLFQNLVFSFLVFVEFRHLVVGVFFQSALGVCFVPS